MPTSYMAIICGSGGTLPAMLDSRMEGRRIIAQRTPHPVRCGLMPSWLRQAMALACIMLAAGVADAQTAPANPPRHAIAMHGEPAFPATFAYMPYVNPDAPKGGRLVYGSVGTFDSLNPLIVRGVTLQQIRGYVVESL